MKKLFILLIFVPSFLFGQEYIGDYYIHPDGNDNWPGSWEQPWATWEKAYKTVQAGDTVYIRGGVYYANWDYHERARIKNSGTREEPICFFAYPGEKPILDGDSLVYFLKPNLSGDIYNMGVVMNSIQYIYFKGLEFRHFYQYDYASTGANWVPNAGVIRGGNCANLKFEDITIHDCGAKGYYVSSGFWNEWDSTYAVDVYGSDPKDCSSIFDYDTTIWKNCDVYNMADPYSDPPGDHADCWKIENFQGSIYTLENCRGWNYTDDGVDANHAGVKILKNVWLMSSKKYAYLEGYEGNGFKMTAHPALGTRFDLLEDKSTAKFYNCIAMFCTEGYYNNLFLDVTEEEHVSNYATYYNNMAYGNGAGFEEPTAPGDTVATVLYINNVGLASTKLVCDKPKDFFISSYVNFSNERNNNWDYVYHTGSCPRWNYTTQFDVTEEDFENGLDSLTLVSLFTAPREEINNALPFIKPFALAPTSDLIDAGYDVGLPYAGEAPDVGPFEYNPSGNLSPNIEITSPQNNQSYSIGESINIRISASDADGNVERVIIYSNNEVLETLDSEPWSYDWDNAPYGTHLIRAVAIDDQDGRRSSKTISVTVNSEGELFPNPNHGKFSLYLRDPLPTTNSFEIINSSGDVIYADHKEWGYLNELDLSFLKKGVYILRIPQYSIISPQRFIKL